jgi:L-ascorbate metabolism protein UlaG (beta-lactamase superfamily)
MENPNYVVGTSKNRLKIEYFGLSCFVITSSNGIKIITDPFFAGQRVLHTMLRKEPADVVTVSCGSYAHCHVFDVGDAPYAYQITEPTELAGIVFRGVATRHLEMLEVSTTKPADNVVMCFEVDGIKLCHLGALGHKLTDEQAKQIGKVDILMVPVGGVSTLPVEDAREVAKQLNPQIILPMHYRSERCDIPGWAGVEEFFNDRPSVEKVYFGVKRKYYENVLRSDLEIGSSALEFQMRNGKVVLTSRGANDQIPAETLNIIVPRFVY